ncbi:ACP S-malonyltransferase [Streptomyces coffeae]|nr:ACP S-malonyltransferase [Streptomyces coffeae]
MTRTVFMFSGQGSQYHQMGRELYDSEPVFRDTLHRLDALVAPEVGGSVIARMYDAGHPLSRPFTDTRYTNPAIVMVELALAETLVSHGVTPDLLLGVSLGEYTASVLAGVMEPGDCLRRLVGMARSVSASVPGGMLAVLADEGLYHREPVLHQELDLAARNYDEHFVVAGPVEALERAEAFLSERQVPFQRVFVSHGFHSRLMDASRPAFEALWADADLRPPRIPLVSSATAGPLTQVTPEHLWRVARQPMEFAATVRALEPQGPHLYIDAGPSGTLHNFVRALLAARTGTRSESMPLLSQFTKDARLLTRIRDRAGAQGAPVPVATPAVVAKGSPMKVYGFPGQGSQVKGMGANLFDEFPELVEQADEILGYSLRELCLTNPEGRLKRTEFTQPALYAVEALTYLRRARQDPPPDYLIGHSLGEYAALFAADAFDFGTGLRLVARRGKLMGRATGGGMAAVLGLDLDTVEAVLTEAGPTGVDIANHNSPEQIVVAGPTADLDRAREVFEARGARVAVLNVSAPFHSRYMRPTAEEFRTLLDATEFRPPKIPVIANLDARPHRPERVREVLAGQIAGSVRWVDTIRYLLERGDFEFEELGPGRTLTKLVAKVRQLVGPVPPTGTEWAVLPWTEPLRSAEPVSPPRAKPEASPATASVAAGSAVGAESMPRPAGPPPADKPWAAAPSVAVAGTTALGTEAAAVTPAAAHAQPSAALVPPAPGAEPEPLHPPAALPASALTPESLGASAFRTRYGLRYAYLAGGMYGGVSSEALLIALAQAGGMAFFGAAGLPLAEVETSLRTVRDALGAHGPFGVNLLHRHGHPHEEQALVDLLLRLGITVVEASGFLRITPALVKYRFKGGRVIAKVSRTDTAEMFLRPAPDDMVRALLERGEVTEQEAARAAGLPMADDLCVEGSGWHAEAADLAMLLPAVLRLRDALAGPWPRIHVGAAGGIGTPEAAAAAMVLGAEFLLTGSVNQCTVEAATSTDVKEMLERLDIHDTEPAPWDEMFELGVRTRVVKRGVFFPARADRLYQLWRMFDGFDELGTETRRQIEDTYLRRSFEEAWREAAAREGTTAPEHEVPAKRRLALACRTYLHHGFELARTGVPGRKVDYLVYCGPAMGAFNQWVRGSSMEPWQARTIDAVTDRLLSDTARLLTDRGVTVLPAM